MIEPSHMSFFGVVFFTFKLKLLFHSRQKTKTQISQTGFSRYWDVFEI